MSEPSVKNLIIYTSVAMLKQEKESVERTTVV